MKYYHMELVHPDDLLIVDVVNQGIDSHLQAITDSSFIRSESGRLICDISPNDLRVIIRRLLESDDDDIESAENLVLDIAGTIGIEEIWLALADRFYITLSEDYFEDAEKLEILASELPAYILGLDLPYISVFDTVFWPALLEGIE